MGAGQGEACSYRNNFSTEVSHSYVQYLAGGFDSWVGEVPVCPVKLCHVTAAYSPTPYLFVPFGSGCSNSPKNRHCCL